MAAGPGINDNGSGVAAAFETAIQLAHLDARMARRVRFAFWSGEEDGLHGSTHYVSALDDKARCATSGYINLDMVGSPNPVPHVYDGFGDVDHPVGQVMADFSWLTPWQTASWRWPLSREPQWGS